MILNLPKPLLSVLILLIASFSIASDLQIKFSEFYIENWGEEDFKARFKVHLQWNNAWNNAKNHDAVWLFFKVGPANNPNRFHAKVAMEGHQSISTNNINPAFQVPDDQAGIFLYPSQKYRGNIDWIVTINLDHEIFQRLSQFNLAGQSYGIEMVFIPQGSFTLGDPDPQALDFNSFYKSDANGEPDGLVKITSENEIPVGTEKGNLYYKVETPEYQGDQQGPIPGAFPKGYRAFYIMKYETTQGQYADFLNALASYQTMYRANFGMKGYYKNRGSIKIKDDVYYAEAPDRPANYISWDDGLAFADWAGLRPMTEFEFTKACRGPSTPIPHEYPWGTSDKARLARNVSLNDDLVMTNGWDESKLNDDTRDIFGASYYWVMDLAGSVWERVITLGHPKGRSFAGSHGDGMINSDGFATNSDWPHGDVNSGGYGYRGGGYYEHFKPAGEFNPHSPIAYRRFGSWAGGNRSIAYSNRYVRTAPN